jgi:hypothetical protein
MTQTLIRYVGNKPAKKDNVAGTGLVWAGKGDVKPVPAAAAAALLRFPDVWRLADAPAGGLDEAKLVPAPAMMANALLGLTVLQLLELAEIAPSEAVQQLRDAGLIEAPKLTGMHLADLLEGAGIAPSEALRMLQAACASEGQAEDEKPADAAEPPPVLNLGTDLTKFDDEALRAAIKAQGLGVDCRKRGDALRTAVADALKAKG